MSSTRGLVDRDTLCKSAPNAERLVEIYEIWSRINYLRTPKDDETVKDIAHEDATILQHAPVMGVKEGKEKAQPIWDVSAQVVKMMPLINISRNDMVTAVHPEGTSLAVLMTIHLKLKFVPCYTMKVPMLFVFKAVADDEGTLKMSAINEHEAKTEEEGLKILQEEYNWPTESKFVDYTFSGQRTGN